jgi:hypothetical protein
VGQADALWDLKRHILFTLKNPKWYLY